MADAFKKGVVLAKEDGSMTTYFQNAIKRYQTDGVSMQTKVGLAQAMPDEYGPKAQRTQTSSTDGPILDASTGQVRDDGTSRRAGATIRMPDGRYITALEYQKLQQMLLNRR